MIPECLKTPELAALIGCHEETLRRAKDRGELNPYRIGRDLFWPVAEVQAWLEAHRDRKPHASVVYLSEDRGSPTRRTA